MQALSECSIDELTAEQRGALRRSWVEMGLGEHASVAAFARLILELLGFGAPPGLVRDAAKALRDEIGHAVLCFGIAQDLVHSPASPGRLDLSNVLTDSADAQAVLERAIVEGCFAETIAAEQSKACLERAREPRIRSALKRISAEEAAHAKLSWRIVAWLISSDPDLRPIAEDVFYRACAETENVVPPKPGGDSYVERYGVLLPGSRSAIASATMRDVIVPRAKEVFAGNIVIGT